MSQTTLETPSPTPQSTPAHQVAEDILSHRATPVSFRFSPFLRRVHYHGLPADRPICQTYASTGTCPLGMKCPERHVSEATTINYNNFSAVVRPSAVAGAAYYNMLKGRGHHQHHHHHGSFNPSGMGLNSLVCKHWLRGLCKKGEHCEFLHEYNLRKMPECNFFSRNGFCSNGEECLYLHIDPLSRIPPCPHYDRGFCPLGPHCAKRHIRRVLCPLYLAGFCPDGPNCTQGVHPKFLLHLEPPAVKAAPPTVDTPAADAASAFPEDPSHAHAQSSQQSQTPYWRRPTEGGSGTMDRDGSFRGRGGWRGRGQPRGSFRGRGRAF